MVNKVEKPLILIVDDTPENLDVLGGILGKEYQVKAAVNGVKALKIAQGEKKPDMILLDIMMPDMDGYEVCRRLKANPATANIPVIFVTAKTKPEDERMGLELGAVDTSQSQSVRQSLNCELKPNLLCMIKSGLWKLWFRSVPVSC